MPFDDLSKKLHAPVDEADALALHVAGATVRHRNPFEDLAVPRNAEELPEDIIEKWVLPFYRVSLGDFNAEDTERFAAGAREIDVAVVRVLLGDFDWRPRIVGAYFAAINGYRELEDILGTHLLKSEVCYAGAGYCLALASFATDAAKRYLREYLDYYLGRPDLWFDQLDAFCALERLDRAAAKALLPQWRTFAADKPNHNLDRGRAGLEHSLTILDTIRREAQG